MIIIVTVLSTDVCLAAEAGFVDVSQQIYSYDDMTKDIELIAAGHEDVMSYEPIAISCQGRKIWLIKFGNLQSENKILITGSIHAREYMTSQLIMKMLEEYVLNMDVVQDDGFSYRQYFQSVCFYILPMVNPDGVAISQYGVAGATLDVTQEWLQELTNAGVNLTQIKSNARGVDINRNFPAGFGQGSLNPAPTLERYCGISPISEIETRSLSNVVNANNFKCCVNYHSMGNLIFYGTSATTEENAKRNKELALLAKSITGYKLKRCGEATGSFADYFYSTKNAPCITIEIGTANPVPIRQFSNIYKRNINLWKVIATQ
jgi:g-D-glutamyl-meso-diaminopimelate peptidase